MQISRIHTRPHGTKEIFYDLLTGLPNRWRFEKRLQQIILHEEVTGKGVSLLYLDISGLKPINLALGHSRGDAILNEAVRRLDTATRDLDNLAILARLDGTEFAVILNSLDDEQLPQQVAEHLLAALMQPFVLQGHTFHLTTRIGISICPSDADNGTELYRLAYHALQHAEPNQIQRYRA